MKNTYIKVTLFLISTFVSQTAFAQVGIGKTVIDGSGLLDFPLENKGIVLPATQNVSGQVAGTLTFDVASKKMQYYDGTNWINLSAVGKYDRTINTSVTEDDLGVIIGSTTTTAKGVLVLESEDKALILPRVNQPEENIPNPEPGMICYDTKSNTLVVYNGVEWSFWK